MQVIDNDEALVDDVERFFDIPESNVKKLGQVSQTYEAWEGDIEILAETMIRECGYDYAIKGRCHDETEEDFVAYCMVYSVVNKCIPANKDTHYGNLYDESRTDRSPLAQVVTSAWYGVRDAMEAYISGRAAATYTEAEYKYAEFALTYDCTSVAKPYATDQFDSYSTAHGYGESLPVGDPIPQIMCQQGGLGDGASGQDTIYLVGYADMNRDMIFGKGDEVFGVDDCYKNRIP